MHLAEASRLKALERCRCGGDKYTKSCSCARDRMVRWQPAKLFKRVRFPPCTLVLIHLGAPSCAANQGRVSR